MVLSQSAFLILVSALRNGRMPLPSNRTAAISRERNDCHLARWAIRLGIRIVHSNLLRGSELTSSNLGTSEATIRDLVSRGVISVEHLPGVVMLADLLTKAASRAIFTGLIKQLDDFHAL